jgi:phosphatidylserine decarboxylase
MKHFGKARQAGQKLVLFAVLLAVVAGALAMGGAKLAGVQPPKVIFGALGFFLILFILFTLYFFRDPEARVPAGKGLVVSPAHGKVDMIERVTEPLFMGECQRVSTFLSVFDVHVQNAPITGKVAFYKYTPGQFLNAMKAESGLLNENALVGIEGNGMKIGVRLLSGLIARRIVPFVVVGDSLAQGERICLIQFGSRVDLYLPLSAKIKVKLGDRVVGGETIMAELAS